MEWQPIETAPKDARILLLLMNGTVICGNWQTDEYAKKPRPYFGNDLSHVYGMMQTRSNQPTHWMPLPAPPCKQST